MKDDNFRDKTTLLRGGKEIIIILVVIFSALSFTLGFFVGKFGKNDQAEVIQQAAAIAPQPAESQPREDAAPATVQEVFVQTTSQPAPDIRNEEPQAEARPEKKYMEPPKEPVKESPKKIAKAPAPSASDIKSSKNDQAYTVQLNALKSSAEAEKFSAKYDKKGYKTYIVVSGNRKGNKIYKIRTGEFSNKQEAEILSLKLRKAEGLNTFVTQKNR